MLPSKSVLPAVVLSNGTTFVLPAPNRLLGCVCTLPCSVLALALYVMLPLVIVPNCSVSVPPVGEPVKLIRCREAALLPSTIGLIVATVGLAVTFSVICCMFV